MNRAAVSTQSAYLTAADALRQRTAGIERSASPEQALESLLAIWWEIFGRADIGPDDDFFALGGHSLKALQLQVQVRNRMGYEMDPRCLFDVPTVAELAEFIRAEMTASAALNGRSPALPEAAVGPVIDVLRLEALDATRWERCAHQVVERHESLRATITMHDGTPRLRIAPYRPFAVPVVDLSALAESERDGAADRLLADEAALPFDPNDGLRCRFGLIHMEPGRFLVSLTVASEVVESHPPRALMAEMLALYAAHADGPLADVKPALSEAAAECLVPLRREGRRAPLFWVHGAGGGAMNLLPLARALDPDQPVYGLQAKGYSGRSRPLARIEDMAAYYIEALRAVQPAGPYRLCGYSFGGMVAYEMALQLREQGETVALLGVMDTVLSGGQTFLTLEGSSAGAILRRLGFRAQEFLATPLSEKLAYVRERWQRLVYRLRMSGQARRYRALQAQGQDIPDGLIEIQALSEVALAQYQPRLYPGSVVLFQSQHRLEHLKTAQVQSWTRLAGGGLDVVPIPGDHTSMLEGENVAAFARVLETYLAPAGQSTP